MTNLRVMSAVRKPLCPNCGEDFITGPMGVPICPSCDVEPKEVQDEKELPFHNEREFTQLVKSDLLNDNLKDPILRTPEILPLWLNVLLGMMQETNERVGSINLELRRCTDETAKKQMSYSLSPAIGLRSKIQTRLFEADRLLGIERKPTVKKTKPQTQEVKKEPIPVKTLEVEFAPQIESLKTQVKQLEGKIKQKENEIQQIKTNYEAFKKASNPDTGKLRIHADKTNVDKRRYWAGLSQLKTLIENDVLDKEKLLGVINQSIEEQVIVIKEEPS